MENVDDWVELLKNLSKTLKRFPIKTKKKISVEYLEEFPVDLPDDFAMELLDEFTKLMEKIPDVAP